VNASHFLELSVIATQHFAESGVMEIAINRPFLV
jgi:hypothetical protein